MLLKCMKLHFFLKGEFQLNFKWTMYINQTKYGVTVKVERGRHTPPASTPQALLHEGCHSDFTELCRQHYRLLRWVGNTWACCSV